MRYAAVRVLAAGIAESAGTGHGALVAGPPDVVVRQIRCAAKIETRSQERGRCITSSGRTGFHDSHLIYGEERGGFGVADDGAVAAEEQRA